MLKQLLLSCFIYSSAARTRICNLKRVPIETIPVSSVAIDEDPNRLWYGEEEEHRRLRSAERYNAISVKNVKRNHSTQRQEGLDKHSESDNRILENIFTSDENSSDNNEDTFQGRICDCDWHWLPNDSSFYCPAHTNECNIWTTRYSNNYRVSCTTANKTIGFARYIWYYLVFLFLIIFVWCFCSRSGHHAIKFLLVQWFPKVNDWITETLLQRELQERDRVVEEYAYAAYLQRRTNGWVSGYKLKVKQFSNDFVRTGVGCEEGGKCGDDTDTEKMNENNVVSGDDVQTIGDDTVGIMGGNNVTNSMPECSSCVHTDGGLHIVSSTEDSNEDHVCTICLLEIENGEQIADLRCRHLYHSDCLSSWVLKKNSCPLCQESNIAEEIRSFETEEFVLTRNDDIDSKPLVERWRHYAKEKCIDFATGHSSQQKRQLRRNIYTMQLMHELNNAGEAR